MRRAAATGGYAITLPTSSGGRTCPNIALLTDDP